jgi:hypothetical protein
LLQTTIVKCLLVCEKWHPNPKPQRLSVGIYTLAKRLVQMKLHISVEILLRHHLPSCH